MNRPFDRRRFLAGSLGVAGLSLGAGGCRPDPSAASRSASTEISSAAALSGEGKSAAALFRISLAQWSLHRSHFGSAVEEGWEQLAAALRDDPRSALRGELDPLDFPKVARALGIDGVEYVNTFFKDRARDSDWLGELRSRCEGEGVESLLIMCDGEGNLGDPDAAARAQAVDNHEKWLEAAAFLGCHAIRVNAASRGDRDEQKKLSADGLRGLCELADDHAVDVLVENHGGLSSDGQWLAETIAAVDHPRAGTLPDFGNFRIGEDEVYDRYLGVEQLMPKAKAVSAKSYDFDPSGNETTIDFPRMMKIVLDAGYRQWVGIEYEGRVLPEMEGIRKTQQLLERTREELASNYL